MVRQRCRILDVFLEVIPRQAASLIRNGAVLSNRKRLGSSAPELARKRGKQQTHRSQTQRRVKAAVSSQWTDDQGYWCDGDDSPSEEPTRHVTSSSNFTAPSQQIRSKE